jgi:hypothetical protein
MLNSILLALCLAAPATDLDQAVQFSRAGNHEASEQLLSKVKEKCPTYCFYKMINAYKLNNKQESIKWAETLLDTFNQDIPIRYKDMAVIIKADAETWKDKAPDDLEDIAREMTKIKDRLDNKMGGPKTQELQKDVLGRLGKMIKDKEDAIAAAQAAKEKAEAEELEKRRKEMEGGGIIMPAEDTIKPSERGKGYVDNKRIKEIAAVWGKLPEKERAKAMVELTRTLPTKDRVVIERYFKELAKRSSK